MPHIQADLVQHQTIEIGQEAVMTKDLVLL